MILIHRNKNISSKESLVIDIIIAEQNTRETNDYFYLLGTRIFMTCVIQLSIGQFLNPKLLFLSLILLTFPAFPPSLIEVLISRKHRFSSYSFICSDLLWAAEMAQC